jgi:hypothetical protein
MIATIPSLFSFFSPPDINFYYCRLRLSFTSVMIHGICCMAFDIFKAQFHSSINQNFTTGIRGAFVEGCTYGVGQLPFDEECSQ